MSLVVVGGSQQAKKADFLQLTLAKEDGASTLNAAHRNKLSETMTSRFGAAALHQRDARNDLFKGYTGAGAEATRSVSASPSRPGGYGYGYGGGGANGTANGVPSHLAVENRAGYRPATPNSRGQYSNAVLDELESQNDQQVAGILGKVKVLKDMTVAIGDEIRDSSALAEKMNDSFDRTRLRLRGTMNRMLLMAERTGVGWRVWLGFFAAVVLIFMYVWLF
ncbi:hypothetical protein P8C59_007266 [Phyllachora maydis]|uniref:t-SNARE coiled-coil homology domain-containing protein n=1 Tax=Phyllachora maydis TaxID=1825666 RepID=A0AAD9MGM6_9PEZI|nr:hypothetical protein P8C59_007266 [Phyllachora maydis]